jgi:hypothetical protein
MASRDEHHAAEVAKTCPRLSTSGGTLARQWSLYPKASCHFANDKSSRKNEPPNREARPFLLGDRFSFHL